MAGKKGDDDGCVGGREELPKRFCSWPLDKVGKGDTTMVTPYHASVYQQSYFMGPTIILNFTDGDKAAKDLMVHSFGLHRIEKG